MNLADHLWQSTVFAASVGLFTLVFRSNRARVRHWLWFAASVKFLIPLSLLISLGSQIEWKRAPVRSRASVTANQIVEPFTVQVFSAAPRPPVERRLPTILFTLWLTGAAGISGAWLIRWRRIGNTVHNGKLLQLDVPLRVVCSATKLEPGVFGIFRPVLLLPEGIFDRLPPVQLRAILAHELCHVRHRDNLLATIHMFVETIFWFHPLVWWIGRRMVEERELACDEEVLQTLGEPQAYAEGVLNVCKLYVESPLQCVSGVTGAGLKKRIEAIMKNRVGLKLNLPKKTALIAAGMTALAVPIAIGIVNTPSARAQSAAKFEVVSIRPAKECGGPTAGAAKGAFKAEFKSGGPPPGQGPDFGRINMCITLANLIPRAYVYAASGMIGSTPRMISPVPVEGGPAWVRSDNYQINAKAENTPGMEMMEGPMMRALLEDRFKLKVRRVTRQVPAYSLSVAKGGKVQQVKGTCAPFSAPRPLAQGLAACGPQGSEQRGANIRWGFIGTAEEFSKILFSWMERPVFDKTRLKGLYDFHVEFAPDSTMPNFRLPVTPDNPIGGTSIFTALQEQLGLRLESTKGSGEFLVIDHVERPSEN